MRSSSIHVTATLLIVIGFASSSAARQTPSPSANQEADNDAIVWGGEHIQLKLTKTGGTVEFDCSTGTIAKPIRTDSRGNFRSGGTYTREMPGPTKRDGNPVASATYSGSIVGGTMRLHIVTAPGKEVVGDYVLVRGESGRVTKCR
jgi:hypothetical protein